MSDGENAQRYVNPPIWFWGMCLAGLAWYVQESYEFYRFYIEDFTSFAELPINKWHIGITAMATFSGLFGFISLMLNSSLAVLLFKICVAFTAILVAIAAMVGGEAPNVGYLPNEAHSLFLFFISLASGYFANNCHKKGWTTI